MQNNWQERLEEEKRMMEVMGMVAFTIKHRSPKGETVETVLAQSSKTVLMYALENFGAGAITVQRAVS